MITQLAFRRLVVPAVLAAALALGACGSTPPAAIPTEAPAAEAPTRTPRPTREPTAEPEPTEEPTEEPVPTPADTLGDTGSSTNGELAAVEIGDLETYAHPSGVFSIDVPANWTLQDNSKPDELILVWTDPTRNGGVIVDIFEDDSPYSAEQLTDLLNSFLENSFGSQDDFSADEPVTQSDDSILIAWSYTAQADNDVQAELLGNSFVEQRGNKVSILTTLVPRDQFEDLREETDGIINTYRIDPDAALSAAAGISGDTSGSATDTGSAETGEIPATVVAVGESVDVGNLTMTVTGVEEPAGDDFFKPDAGNKFLIVRVSFTNNGGEAESVSTLLQMSLVGADGTKYDLDISAAVIAEQTPDGEIAAGDTLEGGVGFQVPADAAGLVFVFDPIINGEPVGVQL